MPGIFYRPIRRRQFIRSSLEGLAAGFILSRLQAADSANGSGKSFHLALISDTHVAADLKSENRKFLPAENLKLVSSQILEVRPEAIVLDGDAARLTGELAD